MQTTLHLQFLAFFIKSIFAIKIKLLLYFTELKTVL